MGTATPPRVVVAHRSTEWDLLLERHATAGQARFFLESRDRDVDDVVDRHRQQHDALAVVDRGIPTTWRRARVDRNHLASFLFEPGDIVVAVGQDGLVPNLAKYLTGQPVVGINPDPDRNEGLLVRFPPHAAGAVLPDVAEHRSTVEERTMTEARLDDGQRLIALNEIFVGHRTHQSARYLLMHGATMEHQSSSGIIVSTGTGATGWTRSIANERRSELRLPSPTDQQIAFFVREAWPSVATGAELTEGLCDAGSHLRIISEMDEGGVVFGDGIEVDRLDFGWGQELMVGPAPERLHLVTP